ncbi:MAG: hypothetical protein QM760_15795 [Nibricoccus sp.]
MKYILFSFIFMSAIFSASASESENRSARVLKVLVSCSRWEELDYADAAGRERLLKTFMDVAKYDDAVVREAIQKYIAAYYDPKARGEGWRLSIFNLLILNRVLFDVPETVSKQEYEAGDFSRWSFMTRTDGDKVNILWPLERSTNKRLILAGSVGGYNGPLPDPVREFDFFKDKYARRAAIDACPKSTN